MPVHDDIHVGYVTQDRDGDIYGSAVNLAARLQGLAKDHEIIASKDVVVNGIMQDTNQPLMFVRQDEIDKLKPGCLIIDISCDEGMGFEFAKPTSFEAPMFKIGKADYYAVDHTPSYLWNSASWEISNSLLPYLPLVMGGHHKWEQSQTLQRAIEIRDGVVLNSDIVAFQNRRSEYPHEFISEP